MDSYIPTEVKSSFLSEKCKKELGVTTNYSTDLQSIDITDEYGFD